MAMTKTAIVTGASKGLGKAWAVELSNRGFHVIVTARDLVKAEKVTKEILKLDNKATAAHLDVSNEESISELKKMLELSFNTIDLIINNAGINPKDFSDPLKKAQAFELDHLSFDVMNQVYNINGL